MMKFLDKSECFDIKPDLNKSYCKYLKDLIIKIETSEWIAAEN